MIQSYLAKDYEHAIQTIKDMQLVSATINKNHDGTFTVKGFLPEAGFNFPKTRATVDNSRINVNNTTASAETVQVSNFRATSQSVEDKLVLDFKLYVEGIEKKYETSLKVIALQSDRIKQLEATGVANGDTQQAILDLAHRVQKLEKDSISRHEMSFRDLVLEVVELKSDNKDIMKAVMMHSESIDEIATQVLEYLAKDKEKELGVIVAESPNIADND